jgi:hypothetical protein
MIVDSSQIHQMIQVLQDINPFTLRNSSRNLTNYINYYHFNLRLQALLMNIFH